MSKKTGLGRGIEALFTNNNPTFDFDESDENKKDNIEEILNDENTIGVIKEIKLVDIVPNKEQARKIFDMEKLSELADSIKTFGVLQPIIITKVDDYYVIVAGERRWRAAKMAGLKTIPAIINNETNERNDQISIIENLQRENLNPIEKARGIFNLLQEYHLSAAELSRITGISTQSVANSVKILRLDDDLLDMLQEANLNEASCLAVLQADTYELQKEVILYMIEDGLTALEAFKRLKIVKKEKAENPEFVPIFREVEHSFQNYFGNKVQIRSNSKNQNKGKIIIEYNSNDDLERMLSLVNSENNSEFNLS